MLRITISIIFNNEIYLVKRLNSKETFLPSRPWNVTNIQSKYKWFLYSEPEMPEKRNC